MEFVYRQHDISPELLRRAEAEAFTQTTASALNQAVQKGIGRHKPSDIMVRRLQEANYVFSGFKTFHEMKEAFPSLLDEGGNRKPFKQFLNDVQTVNEKYNRLYLKAEYDFAVTSAEMAAKWEQYEADGDRYLLQYRTAGDSKVRESHRKLDGITLPPSSPFWNEYFPPNGWRCRCTVTQVRRGKYPESDEREALGNGTQATAGKHQEMMRFNPGKRMACFPAYNPYTINRCDTCDKNGLQLVKAPKNELCAACKVIREMQRRKEELKKQRTEIRGRVQYLKKRTLRNRQFGKEISVSGSNIKEWLNQPHKWIAEKNRMLLNIEQVMAEASYLGYGPDKHDSGITMHLFETMIHEEKSWIIVRELVDGAVKLHSISDSEDILQYLTNKRE